MPELKAAVGWLGRLTGALAGLVVVAACASGGAASTTGSSSAGTGAAPSPSASSATAKADVKQAGFLNGVSCASAANCTAVGDYHQSGTGPMRTLIEHWDGTTWRIEPSPALGRYGTLDAVACPGATSCTAVGSMIIGWNGVVWKVERWSSPFVSVSCTAPSSCLAVGIAAGGKPVFGYWDGSRWKIMLMPRPPSQAIVIAGVSCSGPSFCLAVGDYSNGVGAKPSPGARDFTLVERWDGVSWQIIHSLNAASWNKLSAVSCTSPSACTAVGSSGSGEFPLAERWDGSTWTIQHVPPVDLIGYTQLTAVSCSSVSACMATGTYDEGVVAIAESWDGAAWKLHRMPGPPQPEPFVRPAAVSCSAPAPCVAVGTDGGKLAELWTGTRWRITPA